MPDRTILTEMSPSELQSSPKAQKFAVAIISFIISFFLLIQPWIPIFGGIIKGAFVMLTPFVIITAAFIVDTILSQNHYHWATYFVLLIAACINVVVYFTGE
jgi:hypothetical protein